MDSCYIIEQVRWCAISRFNQLDRYGSVHSVHKQPNTMPKTAILILTHFVNAHIIALFDRLRTQAPDGHDVFLAINCEKGPLSPPTGSDAVGEALFLCNSASLLALAYPEKCKPEGWTGRGWTTNPGNADLITLAFYRTHPDYAYYWGVEYDVHYQGDWGFFLRRFAASDADVLGTSLYKASDTPENILMPFFVMPGGQEPELDESVHGFFPLFRVSNRAACLIDEAYRRGWGGHHELTWGTIAKRHGLAIEDVGGDGIYVKPHNRNAFYFSTKYTRSQSPGTFVFRPAFTKIFAYENTLWHPVKPTGPYRQWCDLTVQGNLAWNLRNAVKLVVWRCIIRLWFIICWRKAT
jgi:hypothetical protein